MSLGGMSHGGMSHGGISHADRLAVNASPLGMNKRSKQKNDMNPGTLTQLQHCRRDGRQRQGREFSE